MMKCRSELLEELSGNSCSPLPATPSLEGPRHHHIPPFCSLFLAFIHLQLAGLAQSFNAQLNIGLALCCSA